MRKRAYFVLLYTLRAGLDREVRGRMEVIPCIVSAAFVGSR